MKTIVLTNAERYALYSFIAGHLLFEQSWLYAKLQECDIPKSQMAALRKLAKELETP